jgi:hypothetical protein
MRAGILGGLWGVTLLLGTGCLGGKGFAPDLLPKLGPDQRHPPDGLIAARPETSKPEAVIRVGYLRIAPAVDLAAVALALTLKPYGSFNTPFNPQLLCGGTPCSTQKLWVP